MVFTSPIFLYVFLPLVLLGWHGLRVAGVGIAASYGYLALSGLVFFGWDPPWFSALLVAMSLADYMAGGIIHRAGAHWVRHLALALSLLNNCGALFVFRHWELGFLTSLVLPVGLAFLVLRNVTYCLGIWRGTSQPVASFLEFMGGSAFFPLLVAGPVVRHGFLSDASMRVDSSLDQVTLGLIRFAMGLAKKVLLADPAGLVADAAFGAGQGSLTQFIAWAGALAFAFQVYFDFSAYADMALGLGRVLGLRLPENFQAPYHSTSFTDFWSRWNVSFVNVLRAEVFAPLAVHSTVVALVVTVLMGGLLHGAGWTFLVWACCHGLMLGIERAYVNRPAWRELPHLVRALPTFVLLVVTWVFFRADSVPAALAYLDVMFRGAVQTDTSLLLHSAVTGDFHFLHMIVCALAVAFLPTTQTFLRPLYGWKVSVGLVLLAMALCMLWARGGSPHLYLHY